MRCNLCLNEETELKHLNVFNKEVCDKCINKYKGDGLNTCLFCGKPDPTDDIMIGIQGWFKVCHECWVQENGFNLENPNNPD